MTQWQLAAMNRSDINPILEIEQHSFAWPWNRRTFMAELANKHAYSFLAKCNDRADGQNVIGYILYRLVEKELHILKIAVKPDWRSRGVATWLLDQCFGLAFEKGASSAFLDVRPSNQSAIALYAKQGFRVLGKKPNYYADTREDALVLVKTLKEDL